MTCNHHPRENDEHYGDPKVCKWDSILHATKCYGGDGEKKEHQTWAIKGWEQKST